MSLVKSSTWSTCTAVETWLLWGLTKIMYMHSTPHRSVSGEVSVHLAKLNNSCTKLLSRQLTNSWDLNWFKLKTISWHSQYTDTITYVEKKSRSLREHVFWSAFNTYPTRHWQLYESPLLIHICWQSCLWAQASEPGDNRNAKAALGAQVFGATVEKHNSSCTGVNLKGRTFLREHVFWSMFNVYPTRHLQM